jgi:hypothetical protein
MFPMILCLAAAALGFDVGWQPRPQGGIEYVIQLSLPAVEALRAGEMIQSDIPPEVKDVRAFRLAVGSGRLPHELPTTAAMPPTDALLPPPTAPTIDPNVADVSPIGPVEGPSKASPRAAPQPLPPGVAGRPIPEHAAAFVQAAGETAQASPLLAEKQATSEKQPTSAQSPPPESRPWLLLTCVSLGLFASLGGNLYLGWITWDVQRRYRAIVTAMDKPA